MCDKRQLAELAESLAAEAKKVLAEKFDAVILYGSYARGDYDEGSDVDFLIRIRCDKNDLRSYRRLFTHFAGELSLKYAVTVSVQLADVESYEKYKEYFLYYKNIERDGIYVA